MQFAKPSEDHLKVLKNVFGHNEFKLHQWEIIRAFMYDRKDGLVIASTGFGKSLIYQYPAVYLNKLTIVISPLISLMQDQVFALKKKGVKACFLGSNQMDKTLKIEDHNVVYMCPEYLFGRIGPKKVLENAMNKLLMFAVDEAHVLEQWADFRAKYRELHNLKVLCPNIPVIALTATAPEYLQDIIVSKLNLRNYAYLKTALDRPNLEFEVRRKRAEIFDLLPLLNPISGSAIVYVTYPEEEVTQLSDTLRQLGINCRPYHSKLKSDFKAQVVSDFKSDKVKVVIATIAFGMGIDKPDVRLVVHYNAAKSIESYYQEAGRAGRDGKPSKRIIFHSDVDISVQAGFIADSERRYKSTQEQREQMYQLLNKYKEFINSDKCRRIYFLSHLGTTKEELAKLTIRGNCCDNCRRDLLNKIPPSLKYEEIDKQGNFDFTTSVRTLLFAVNPRLTRTEVLSLLLGELPTSKSCRFYNLKCFNEGRDKPKDWWEAMIGLLITHKYLQPNGNSLELTKIARDFLRFKGRRFIKPPNIQSLKNFTERKEIEFYWDNDIIRSRPKGAQQTSLVPIDDDDEIDEKALLQACMKAEETFRNSEEMEIEDDLLILQAIEKMEAEVVNKELRKISNQDDTKLIASISIEHCDDIVGESSNKRVHVQENCDEVSTKLSKPN